MMAQKDRDMKKQAEWSRAYNEKSYDRLYPFVPKGKKAEIQAAAEEQGETINEFIVKAIEERMSRLQTEKPFIPPQGEFCPPNCKKRGAKITGPGAKQNDLMISDGIPWCFAHGTELEWKDKEAGICFKCEKCNKKSANGREMT